MTEDAGHSTDVPNDFAFRNHEYYPGAPRNRVRYSAYELAITGTVAAHVVADLDQGPFIQMSCALNCVFDVLGRIALRVETRTLVLALPPTKKRP